MTKPKKNIFNVHTLRDIKNRGVVGFTKMNIPSGHWLGSICESELEKALRSSIKTASNIANEYKDLQAIYLERIVELEDVVEEEDLLEVLQNALLKRNSFLQEADLKGSVNTCLAKQIPKISNESKYNEVIGGASKLEKENKNTKFQSTMQKNIKTKIPPMKLCLLDMNEVTKHESFQNISYPSMTWTFSMIVSERSGIGKANLLRNLVLSNKDEYIQEKRKDGSSSIQDVSMVINSYLHKEEFIVFDLLRPKDDSLAIRLRFDIPLNLQKEIEMSAPFSPSASASSDP
ncbi:hypothetical protein C1645_815496 [Glomus cerebriforme]|uniref:Uncharacterized protein n=1 Tax=Glomus cerebriforme TaxID=658196 RepID=A0A397TIP1_9GLOM|nr:hypothetical protein C1645_815496 [Glomus cerebriforme]